MKRLIPVLAIALILILTTWDQTSAKKDPNRMIEVTQYDHPWGGESHNTTTPPGVTSTRPIIGSNYLTLQIFKIWKYNLSYTRINSVPTESGGTTTGGSTTTTTTSETPSNRGTGQ